MFLLYIVFYTFCVAESINWLDLNLHEDHIPRYFQSHPELKNHCAEDADCPYKVGERFCNLLDNIMYYFLVGFAIYFMLDMNHFVTAVLSVLCWFVDN